MKTVFIILLVIFVYNVEGIKIRAIRRRTIQYIPLKHNQNTHTQTQNFRWLPQNQPVQIYKNDRPTYSYVKPGGVRYNMFSGSGAYGNNFLNNRNREQRFESTQQNWPSYAVRGISVEQNRLNSAYNGLIGQSAYQGWQHSASGSPIYVSVQQNGINPGHKVQNVYQTWKNVAGGRPGDVSSMKQYGMNSGHKGDIDLSLYQHLQHSAYARPNDAYVVQSGLNHGNIGQSVYQSWHNAASARPIDITAEQNGVNPRNFKFLQSSAPGSPVNFPTEQTVFNDQPKDQYLQSAEDGGVNLSNDQSVPNSVNGGPNDYSVQQSIPNFGQINYDAEQSGQHSDNGDQASLSLNQGDVDSDHEPQFINEIKVNAEETIEPIQSVSEHDLIYSLDETKLNQPNETPLQDIVKDMNEKISPVDTDTQNYLISRGNGMMFSVNQSKLNWPNEASLQNILKDVHITNEGNSPIGAVNKNYLKSPDKDGLISVDQSKLNWSIEVPLPDIMKDVHRKNEENIIPINAVTQSYQISPNNEGILSVDQSKLNEAPLQDIVKEINIKNEENISPIGAMAKKDDISPDNEGIIAVDQSKLNWPIGDALQDVIPDVHINNEENIGLIDAETQNYKISPGNEGILSVDQSKFNKAPLQDIVKEINISEEENISPIGAIAKNYVISPDNEGIISVDQSKLKWPIAAPLQGVMKDVYFNNEENINPIDPETQNYLIAPDNGGIMSVEQSKFNEAQLQGIINEINFNKEENISPIGAWANQDPLKEIKFKDQEEISPINRMSDIDLISPNNEAKITVDQNEVNGAEQTPLKEIEKDIYVNNEETAIPVKGETINDLVSSDNIGLLTRAKTKANSDPISIAPHNDLISPIDERVLSLGLTNFNEASKGPLENISQEIKKNITENSGAVSKIGNLISKNKNIYGDQINQELIPNPIYLNILKPNKQIGPFPRYSGSLKPSQEQSPASIIYKPNQQQNPTFKAMLNQVVTTRQQHPLNIPYRMPPGNLQWNKPIVRNISPQPEKRVFSSICHSTNPNVIPISEMMYYDGKPAAKKQEIFELIDYLKMFGLRQNPPYILEPPKIGRYTNVEYTKPIFNKNEMYPYYKLGNSDINKYNIPQPSYYRSNPSHAIVNEFNVQSENYKTNENPLQRIDIDANEDETVTKKASDNTDANHYAKGIYPFYKSGNIIFKKYIPQPNHYVAASSPAVKTEFNTNSEYFTPDENLLSQNDIKGRKDYANPIYYKKENNPYNKLINTNLNKYNNPQGKYYIPTYPQAVRNNVDMQIDHFKRNEYSLPRFDIKANEDEEVVTNPPDSRITYIKPNGQKTFATETLVPESPIVSTIRRVTDITGYEKLTTPKEYVYQVTNALMPELLRLYHSKCDNEYYQTLLEEFKKLVDSIQGEHCK